MKPISPAARAIINQRTRVSPVVLISILWGFDDLKWYTSRRIEIPGVLSEARIMTFSEVTCEKRTDNASSTGQLTFELDDSDGFLKNYVDNVRIERSIAQAFLWLDGTTFADRILLLNGKLSNPVWNDDTRRLSLALESVTENLEIGFAPTQQDFKDMSPEAVGAAWPLAFGHVKNVPAVRVRQKTLGNLMADIRLTLPIQKQSDIYNKSALKIRSYIAGGPADTFEDQVLYVADFEHFPTGKPITISVDGVLFRGQFNGTEKFTVETANYPRHQSVKGTLKPTFPESEIVVTGENNLTLGMFAVDLGNTNKISLSNCFCYYKIGSAGPKIGFNFCAKQIGNIAYFKYPFMNPTNGRYFDSGAITFTEVYAVGRTGIMREDVERIAIARQLNNAVISEEETDLYLKTVASPNAFWRRPSGQPVVLWDLDDPDIYIASAIRMSAIDSVYSKKTITLDGKQRKLFMPIPTPYYTKQLASNYKVNNEQVSGLIFHTPLSEYTRQHWEDAVYVTGTSTVGPNPVDIIEYILDRYTDLHMDGSFNAVKAKVNDTPANFALFDRRDALKFAQEIAWQARCVLVKDSDTVGIRYLGEAPNPIMTFDESNVQEYSMVYSTTSPSDILTRYIGTWTDSYKDSPQPQSLNLTAVRSLARVLKTLLPDTYRERTATHMYTREENIDLYGLMGEETNIYIFDNEESVKRTIDFWGHRAANVWKRVSFNPLNLDALALQPYDGIAIIVNLQPTVLNVIATVEGVHYSHETKAVTIDAWLPVRVGTQSVDSLAYG